MIDTVRFQNDPFEWALFGPRGGIRRGWGIFFSLGFGMFLALYMLTGGPVLIAVALIYATGVLQYAFSKSAPVIEVRIETVEVEKEVERIIEIEKRVFVRPDSSCGVIYIMRRSDGVLKFGKAHRLSERLRQHQNDYQTDFHVISSWVVPDVDDFETVALSLTKRYKHKEGHRRELRQMSESELNKFILEFTSRVYKGWIQ